jgi:sigma-B regulation protein RsbU (phosphoserine phosphatase)
MPKWKPTPWAVGKAKWEETARYWRSLPAAAFALLLTGIACLFAAMGVLTAVISAKEMPFTEGLVLAADAAVLAAALAWSVFQARIRWMAVIIFLQFVSVSLITGLLFRHVSPLTASERDYAVFQQRIRVEAVVAMVLIVGGYVALSAFLRKEGMRVFGPLTEIKLASEVHRALVPAVAASVGGFEILGSSVPSGEMGGDLVDIIEEPPQWLAYLADVSGHGVAAGVIMAMVKSATRMGATADNNLSTLLSGLNRVLNSSCASNTFVTFACIAGDGSPRLQFSLAGHPPILHYRKRVGTAEEQSVSNLPLGVLPDSKFETASIDCDPGDVLVVFSDGLTEVDDAEGQELGLDPLKSVLRASAEAPLSEIMNALQDCALKHGKQTDDQTVLLLRRKDRG